MSIHFIHLYVHPLHTSIYLSTSCLFPFFTACASFKEVPSETSALCHSNTLQHTATHCNTLQHTATHCNTLQHTATHCNTLQHNATNCNTLQHTRQARQARTALKLQPCDAGVVVCYSVAQCGAVCRSVFQCVAE